MLVLAAMFRLSVPPAPTQLEGVALSPRTLNLSWVVPELTCTITGYEVSISVEGRFSLLSIGTNTMMIPYQGFDVLPYTTYFVRVAAETAKGRGPFSEQIAIYTPEDGDQ